MTTLLIIIVYTCVLLSIWCTYESYKEMKQREEEIKKETLPGALHLHAGGYLNQEHTKQLINNIDRAERNRNAIVYCKAVRATLLGLGFKQSWVEGTFREELERRFIYEDNQIK